MTDCATCTALKTIDFEAEISTARHDIQQSPSPSPFNRLPTELISRIFRSSDSECVILPPDFTQLPWVLGRVCSRWRSLSRAELVLWGYPIIPGLASTHEKITRAIDILPPGVLIDLTRELGQGESIKPWAPYLSRCSKFVFSGDLHQFDELWASLTQDAFINLTSVSFELNGTRTESVTVRTKSFTLDPEALWGSTAAAWAMALNLHEAKFPIDIFDTLRVPSTILSCIPLPWHQLKTIQVLLDTSTDVEVLWMYLRQCRGLARLKLDVYSNDYAFPGVDLEASIDLPELRTIEIEGRPSHILLPQRIWCNITSLSISSTLDGRIQTLPDELQHMLDLCCTRLEELAIWELACGNGESFPKSSRSLHFPFLRSLRVSTQGYAMSRAWKLDVDLIDAPNLGHLEFDGSISNLLDATRAFRTSLSYVEFSSEWNVDGRENMTPELLSEVLSTLSPTASFVDMTQVTSF